MLAYKIVAVLAIGIFGSSLHVINASASVTLIPSVAQGIDGGLVFLQCNTSSQAKPTLRLVQNGVVVSSSRIYVSKALGGWFVRVGPLRTGTYTLTATSGSSVSSSIIFYKAKNTSAGFPKIGRHPRPRFKTSGDSAIFQCSATGNPKPTILWTKDKIPLVPDGRISIESDGRLVLTNLQKSDQAYYECIAKNKHGMVFSRRAMLFVREVKRKPRFTVKPRDQVVDPDSDVTLNCAADGWPKPSIVWERDGSRISGVSNGVLLIKKIDRSANYTCIADSYMGRVATYAYVTVRPLPFAPLSPVATLITASSIAITWRPSGGHVVTSYNVAYRLKGQSKWTMESNIRGKMSLDLKGLQPFSTYQFQVFAVNSLGSSKGSPLVEFTTSQTKPSSPPFNIEAKGISDTSFKAEWLPPLQPNGPIRGYRLYYAIDLKQPDNLWRFMASATNYTTVTGLSRRTTYYFKIGAYNIAGMGPLSEVIAVKTHKGVPGQPKDIKLEVLTSTSIRISWNKPQYHGDGIFGYEVYYNKTSKDMDTNVEASTAQTKDIMGLAPYTVYNFGVAAKSDKGIGPMSFPTTVRTKEDVPSGAPLNIVGKSRDSTTLEIKWDPPLPMHRNGIITHYYIKFRAKGVRAKHVTVDGIKTSVILHGLKKFTSYFVWVSARTKEGEGPKSDKHVFSTAEDVPSGAPTNLKVKVQNSSCILVTWSPPTSSMMDGKIMGYMVFYSIVDDLGNQLKPPSPVETKDSESENNLKVYLTKLAPETTYQIDVAGYTIKGDGARSVTKLAKTLPRLPDSPFVFVQQSQGSDVVLGWRTSVTDVKEYRIRYARSLNRIRARDHSGMKALKKTMKELPLNKKTTTYDFKGLSRGIWYLFNVSLRTKAGWSPETAKWVQMPPSKPSGPPRSLRTRSLTSTSIRIDWSPPDIWLRNGDITGYIVSYSHMNRRDKPVELVVSQPNQTKMFIRGLKKYTGYDLKVRAVNAFGYGPWSDVIVERTREDRPGPPTDVKLTVQSSTVLSVDWNEPSERNGKIKGYVVKYKIDDPQEKWEDKKSSGLGTILRGLSRDTTYLVKVTARTSQGPGNYSEILSASTLKYDLPGLCREFKSTVLTSNSTTIEWLPPQLDAGIIEYKISYYGSKTYKHDGKEKHLIHSKELSIPSSKQTSKLKYTIKKLNPHMTYKVKISALNKMGSGPEIDMSIKTKKAKPPKFQPPEVLASQSSNGYIPLRLKNASEINGPVSYYLVVVVPLGDKAVLPETIPDDYFKRVKRFRRSAADHKPYIAAKFAPDQMPKIFKVGDEGFKNRYGYYNKRLQKGRYYTLFVRAYVENEDGIHVYTSSPFTDPVTISSVDVQQQIGAKEQASRMTLIIILVVAFVVIIAAVALAVACIVLRRRRRHKKSQCAKDEEKSEPSDPVELRRLNFQTPAMIDHPPIPVTDLAKHIAFLKADGCSKFTQEYESIDTGQSFTSEASKAEVNRTKNRYPNIHAFDHTRVRLTPEEGIPGSDYINANYCDGYRKEQAYIATQGPLPNTAADFWRMVWEQRTFTIVMLTREEERGRVKCDQYWPNDGTNTYDEIEVAVIDWVELANYTITTLQISKDGESQPREVKHFQFTGWPDHGVPTHPTPFLAFLRRVKFYNPPDAGPITVHCSAGVGRTACFIVIDSMLERIKHENTVDIYGHVTVLRTQREFMVQTKEQYMFLHDTLLEAVSSGNTEVHARNLLHHIKKLTELGKGEVTGLEEEFKNLVDPGQARRHKHAAATLTINRPKNRMANILPYEATRVHISPVRGVEGSDYINASFIDGYRQRGAFIATQGPLQDTVDDFWRMLMEQNSNIVVMLTKLQEGEWEKCYKYWPTDRSARHQYYIVDPVAEQEYAQFVIRDFKVKDARNDTVRNIKQFHFRGWPETGVPKTGEGIIDLIGQVQRAYEQQDEDGPVTVHCSDGVGRTGVFCALFIVLERMRSEGVVDLFQTVKLLRTQRPAMVQSQEQYLFCYRTALEYLGSFDHYAI